jgi:hypothetical protein
MVFEVNSTSCLKKIDPYYFALQKGTNKQLSGIEFPCHEVKITGDMQKIKQAEIDIHYYLNSPNDEKFVKMFSE